MLNGKKELLAQLLKKLPEIVETVLQLLSTLLKNLGKPRTVVPKTEEKLGQRVEKPLSKPQREKNSKKTSLVFKSTSTKKDVGYASLILKHCNEEGLTLEQAAYVLATASWETAHTLRPVREAFWLDEKWRKRNLRYYPWYGRGAV